MVTADYKNAQKTVENVSTELGTNLNSKDQNVVSNILSEVAVSPSKYENLYNYLTMSQEDYMAYMINSWHETGVSSYFPDIMRTFFLNYSEVSSIDIVLDDEDVYLHGDRVSIMGKKIAMPYHLLDDELKAEIAKEFPENRKPIFFSGVTQEGIMELKDAIWKRLHGEGQNL